jgi:hypothetical protein
MLVFSVSFVRAWCTGVTSPRDKDHVLVSQSGLTYAGVCRNGRAESHLGALSHVSERDRESLRSETLTQALLLLLHPFCLFLDDAGDASEFAHDLITRGRDVPMTAQALPSVATSRGSSATMPTLARRQQ